MKKVFRARFLHLFWEGREKKEGNAPNVTRACPLPSPGNVDRNGLVLTWLRGQSNRSQVCCEFKAKQKAKETMCD